MKTFEKELKLLIFAEGDGSDGEGGAGADGGDGNSNGSSPITFETQSDLDKWHETRVQKTLEKSRIKWEQETQLKVDEAIKLALEREKLSEKERLALENKEKEQAFLKQQSELLKRELRLDALDLLTEKGLPKELLGTVALNDKETMKKSVEEIGKVFTDLLSKGIEDGVKKRLSTNAHEPQGSGTPNKTTTLGEFAKMKSWEQAEFARNNPEQFKQLTGGI